MTLQSSKSSGNPDDGGRKAGSAPVKFNVKNHGGKNPQFAPVEFNEKNDGGETAQFAHVTKPHDPFLAKFHPRH